jgi:hypothetical protein
MKTDLAEFYGQERLGPSYCFISLLLGPLNSLLWSVPSFHEPQCYALTEGLAIAGLAFLNHTIFDVLPLESGLRRNRPASLPKRSLANLPRDMGSAVAEEGDGWVTAPSSTGLVRL